MLRHIGIEEKLLFPVARQLGDPELQARMDPLHRDHAALAALLVPTPTSDIMAMIETVLARHNAAEEASDGLYAICDRLPPGDLPAVVQRAQDAPPARVAPHYNTPGAQANIRTLLRAANVRD